MAVPEVNKDFLSELEAMGFSEVQANKALHGSGNSSIEAAIDWIMDHENDPEIDDMPLVPLDINIEAPDASEISDQVKIKAQQLRFWFYTCSQTPLPEDGTLFVFLFSVLQFYSF